MDTKHSQGSSSIQFIQNPKEFIKTMINFLYFQLGVREIFTDASNLPKLSTQKKSKIGAVIHKAKIVVNEKGTEAGAGTGMFAK